jgi:hydrogenase maturation protease
MTHDLLYLGLGNPMLCDDRVGHDVACELHRRSPPGSAELELACVGGLELLHLLEGFRRVVIVDAYEPGYLPPGEVAELDVEELTARPSAITPHTASLKHCLELGRICGLPMPEEVRVFVVGVQETRCFGERCTPEVEAAIPAVVEAIERELG